MRFTWLSFLTSLHLSLSTALEGMALSFTGCQPLFSGAWWASLGLTELEKAQPSRSCPEFLNQILGRRKAAVSASCCSISRGASPRFFLKGSATARLRFLTSRSLLTLSRKKSQER